MKHEPLFGVSVLALGVAAIGQAFSGSQASTAGDSPDHEVVQRGGFATDNAPAEKPLDPAELRAAVRRGIESGEIDPLTVVFTMEGLYGESRPGVTPGANGFGRAPFRAAASTENAGGNVLINDDFTIYQPTDFSSVPSSLVPIHNQVNPMGELVGSASWVGVATDAIMSNILPGLPGGMPPSVQPPGGEPYLALARRTGLGPFPVASLLPALDYPWPGLIPGSAAADHARVMTDWYLKDDSTFFSSSTVNNLAGVFHDRVFFGGTDLSGSLAPFVPAGSPNTLDSFVTLASTILPGIGPLFAAPQSALVPFPVNQWFSIMTVVAEDPLLPGNFGVGVFLKTNESVANGFLDPRLASGDIIPIDKAPLGWVNIYPGVDDDLSTPGVIEGIGHARDANSNPAPTTGAFGLGPVSPQSPMVVDGLLVGTGLDPSAATHPSFVPQDAFIDNKPIAGRFAASCPGDLNGDGVVDGVDLLMLLNGWGPCPSAPDLCPGDVNGDGAVDGGDLLVILNGFGAVCF